MRGSLEALNSRGRRFWASVRASPAWVAIQAWIESNPVSLVALLVALGVTRFPHARAVIADLPDLRFVWHTSDRASALLFWAYVIMLLTVYVSAAVAMGPSPRAVGAFRERWSVRFYARARTVVRSVTIPLTGRLLIGFARRCPRGLRQRVGLVMAVVFGVGFVVAMVSRSALTWVEAPVWLHLGATIGLWLLLARLPRTLDARETESALDDLGAPDDYYRRASVATGEVLSMLLCSLLTGSALWAAAESEQLSYWVTHRAYTVWALFHGVLALLAAARLIDTIWRHWTTRVGVACLLGVTLLAASATPEYVGRAIAPSSSVEEREAELSRRWWDAVERRLDGMEPGAPVVLVAASGGGSRAALFTAMSLESLQRMRPEGGSGGSLGDAVLVLSSVSGGSVAAVDFALRPEASRQLDGPPRNSYEGELLAAARRELERLCAGESARSSPLCLERAAGGEVTMWPARNARVDDMAHDFNAAMLRGSIYPRIGRGAAVSEFWERRFTWQARVDDRGDEGGGGRAAPLMLINGTTARDGWRLIMGVPSLPPTLLPDDPPLASAPHLSRADSGMTSARAPKLELERGFRPPIQARAASALDPWLELPVAEAVRVSANAVPAFDVPLLRVGGPGPLPRVLDGAFHDNTGVDGLWILFERLQDMSRGTGEDARRARALLDRLAARGVIAVYIDSEPLAEPVTGGDGVLGGLGLAFSTLDKAVQTRTAGRAAYYWRRIDAILGEVHGAGDRFRQVTLRSQHGENLLTGWALSPTMKGQLIARFLLEESLRRDALLRAWAELRAPE